MSKCCTKYPASTNSAKTASQYHYAIVKYHHKHWNMLK